MALIGLTGNYGMGKTMVLGMFRELGAYTINSDAVVSGLLREGPVTGRVRELLGDSVFGPGGGLVKEKVAEMIFSDPEKRKALEGLLHPLVLKRVQETARGREHEVVVVEVPLLFEGGYEGQFHKTVTVCSDEDTALTRLLGAGVRREDALMRMKAQMPIEEKMRRADFVIENNGTAEELRGRVRLVYDALRACCRSGGEQGD
jgi:dephospho-CoA kinase